ncbi:hypothetical protein ABZ464_27750 [Streptomyces sp. NPDC005820]|uniref:hypothetical protein n=1 Tax=Streptomyces sp. NPDC005820 TaxID=3157069 RepID=UPI0033E10E06
MNGTVEKVTIGWLLGFAAFNAGLGVTWWVRTRTDRRLVRAMRRSAIDPIAAAWWLGGSWRGTKYEDRSNPAKVAVRLLVVGGHARFTDTGGVALVPGPRDALTDPVLAALADGLGPDRDVTLYDLLTEKRFLPFRTVLAERRHDVGRPRGHYRTPAMLAACMTSFGLMMHAIVLSSNGIPSLQKEFTVDWFVTGVAPWIALPIAAAAWPDGWGRPWPLFSRRCRKAIARALADEDPEAYTRFDTSNCLFLWTDGAA